MEAKPADHPQEQAGPEKGHDDFALRDEENAKA
jgi:hypothetical protein